MIAARFATEIQTRQFTGFSRSLLASDGYLAFCPTDADGPELVPEGQRK